jgi:adenylylsulfate kinase
MLTVESDHHNAFGIWVTGLPASGKSTLTAALKEQLRARGVDVAVLESDTLRKTLTPNPRYDEEERDTFYQQLADVGALLTEQGVPVVFDATANRRAYRDRARKQIRRFLEIYVDCSLATCIVRDPKGIYRQAQGSGQAKRNAAAQVPGLQTPYEPPETPDLVVKCEGESPEAAAGRVVALLREKGYIR